MLAALGFAFAKRPCQSRFAAPIQWFSVCHLHPSGSERAWKASSALRGSCEAHIYVGEWRHITSQARGRHVTSLASGRDLHDLLAYSALNPGLHAVFQVRRIVAAIKGSWPCMGDSCG
jgi:hypothetical protein